MFSGSPLRIMLLLLACGSSALACGQASGSIAGTVTDETGAVVVGATVDAKSRATGEEWQTRTDKAGIYSLPVLPPGSYTLSIRASGFKAAVFPEVVVTVTENTSLNSQLRVGPTAESITVHPQGTLLQTNGPQLGRVVENRVVSDLPLSTRNFTQLLALSPGTATYLPDSTAVGRNTQAISVNGARVTQNNYQINGVDANTLGNNGPILIAVPAPETVQEFKVQTSLYDATFGRGGGANIQILTRGGGNQFHGSAYEYFRNEALNANNPFLKAAVVQRPELRRNAFGATLGGPIVRRRLFFFASYQGAREINGASIINSISGNVLVAPGLTNDRSPATLLSTFHPILPNGQPGIDPVALALLNARLPNGQFAVPTPAPDGRYTGSTPSHFDEDQFNTNLDWVRLRDLVTVRFFFANTSQETTPSFRGTGPNVPGFGSLGEFDNRVAAIQHVRTFSATAFNTLRVGYTFNRNNTSPVEPIKDSDVGIKRSNAGEFPGLPLIRIAAGAGGVIIGTAPAIEGRAAPATTTLNDTVSLIRGKHSLRLGTEERYNLIDFTSPRLTRGQIDFQDFNSFLTGNTRVTSFGNGLLGRSWRAFDYDFFIQDDWKVRPTLSLNLGLRYELDLPTYDTRGRLSTFDSSLYQPRMQVDGKGNPVGPPVGGFVQAGNALPQFNLPSVLAVENNLLRRTDAKNLAPRLGLAWAPASGRAVFRGGFGVFYSRPSFQYASLAANLPPYYVIGTNKNSPQFETPFFAVPPADLFPTFVPGVALAGTIFDRRLRTPEFFQYNGGVQYEIRRDLVLEIAYVGTGGVRLFRQVSINQAPLASPANPIINAVTGAVITTNTPGNAQLRAPFQGVEIAGLTQNQSTAQSSYNSLQVSMTKRASHGLQFLASYTFSRSIDNASGSGAGPGISGAVNTGAVGDTSAILGNQLDKRANRGVSDFDRTHRLVASYVWNVPSLASRYSGLRRWILNDWHTAGIITAMSGLPIDIVDTGSGSLYGLANGSTALVRPSFATGADCATAASNVPSGYFFNPFAFVRPIVAAGQVIPSSGGGAVAGAAGPGQIQTDIGDVGRNCLRGPRQVNVDFALAKRVLAREQRYIEISGDFFNLFNQVNLANPISDLNAVQSSGGSLDASGRILKPGNFGQIISTSNNPRIIQLALKLTF